jgi:hypothetical protein
MRIGWLVTTSTSFEAQVPHGELKAGGMKWLKRNDPGLLGLMMPRPNLFTVVVGATPTSDEKCSTTRRFPAGTV